MSSSQHVLGGEGTTTAPAWSRHDTHWVLSLFGTAVGAGILFLPINVGFGGFWPLIIMACAAFPMTYLAHRGLARFVLSSKHDDSDFTDVVQEHFGAGAGRLISLLYFLSIFPILLIYGVGLTNTVNDFIVHQLGFAQPPRALLSGVLVAAMVAVMLGGEKLMLRAFAILVYPLVAVLFGLSLYLIPHWQVPSTDIAQAPQFIENLWLAVPVIVFSFSHAAAISSFANAQRRHYGQSARVKSDKILKYTAIMLISFVLLFVFSCVFALSAEQLEAAKEANISVLSYLANTYDNPLLAYVGPLVAFIAITSSFFGHFLGARESFNGLAVKHSKLSYQGADKLGVALMFVAIWICAIYNPSILDMMGAISGPIIAMILFIMPMIAVYKVPSLARYKGKLSTYFVLLVGVLAVSALLYNLIG
ncbi:Serine transporter [Pseudoalteromonas sp. THAF3]|uniref:aromatic amino acid transport family protein n=1 Tax=Pseudoalteromonas sp. THAF3 TaxID=2587843 RepID=UPI001267C74D|nr:aromatic amino acid transport family protein [Pseudoalteromonas sp. THAF3]QFU04997.1 Serine transporter [Pseudoalteromonas sp. THAF3]